MGNKLISVDEARRRFNSMSRSEKERLGERIKSQIPRGDVGEVHRYYFGNLRPRTRAAIRRALS